MTVTIGEMADGFYVADNGPGIPEADREAVFDAGYSTSTAGTGLGLRIVEQITDAHGWTVDVTDSTTGGSRFEISGVDFID
ncbi:sensor histidine kinase [Halovenus salina]|uniref:histidine kinase n=1 Tax=Halovenus salina TaxID=1510225 RepID=A0ABD5VXM4_9EURY